MDEPVPPRRPLDRSAGATPEGLSALVDAGRLESEPLPGGEGDDADVLYRFELAGPPP